MAIPSLRVSIGLAVGVVAAVVLAVVLLSGPPDPVATSVRIPVADDVTLDATLWIPDGVGPESPASAVLVAHGFGGSRDSVADDARALAARGHVVLAWSARGFGGSGGRIGLNDPDAEIADVSVLVDWLAERPEVVADGPGDPRVGMTGASYGGGATLLAGAADDRIDALVPISAWHSLADSLSPNAAGTTTGVLKQQWVSLLFATGSTPGGLGGLLGPAATAPPDAAAGPGGPLDAVAGACGPFDPRLCAAYAASAEAGRLTDEAEDLLRRADLVDRLADVTAPTLVVHARGDTLFPLSESVANATGIAATGTPVALRWLPGGHDLGSAEGNTARVRTLVGDWLDRWLDDQPVDTGPVFASVARSPGADRTADELVPVAVTDTLAASADGRLVTTGDAQSGERSWITPPGGVPAALTSLPGGGALGELLPPTDLPGQHVAFQTEPLTTDLEVLGAPTLALDLDTSGDEVVLFAKLLDVAPDGSVTLPQQAVAPVRLGDLPASATIALPTLDHTFAAGHRVRLVLAATDQAYANPRATAVTTATVGAGATLAVPTVAGPVPDGTALALALAAVAGLVVLGTVLVLVARRRRTTHEVAVDPGQPAVVVSGLRKTYASGFVAVDGIDLEVGTGQVFGLLGPNGAGKTTTLRMLLGLVAPTAGEVRLLGHRVSFGHPVLRHVGALVEGPGFAPYRSGRDNLLDWWRAGSRPLAEAHLDRALEVAALGDAVDRPVGEYSHGMRQRLAIAQAMLGDPPLLVLDEPTDGLDPGQIRGMRDLLSGLATEGRTVLVSSHLLAEVEQVCTHAAVLVSGRVVAAGPVAELAGATRSVEVRAVDEAGAEAVLVDLLGRPRVQRQGSGLVADLDGRPSEEVVAALVAAGVGLQSVTPRRRLEDAFLQLVEAGR
ncbi:alpha/beta fold hydrolase [Salsipaludibacter albus]|uniref:alpha/beta fold hydrolase n=1 Tax=Salsipaludibacter albus TaxID=2849650 RepID=UPI001EE3E7FD|nr:alpha/beta fold hydrolase [Salsipaludibacter albus]MBY5161511.1 alpha/beta fold hydrolase [Salsipaludibacter albus]